MTVYIGYDLRSSSRPDWLETNGWTPSSESLSSSDAAGNPAFLVYEQSFGAGTVALGGTADEGFFGPTLQRFTVCGCTAFVPAGSRCNREPRI